MTGVEICENFVRNAAEFAMEEIQKLSKNAQVDDPDGVKFPYRDIVGMEAYWNAAAKIYPRMTEAATVLQAVKDVLSKLGSMENVVAVAEKKKQERIKNTFMPKPVVVSAALESEFKEAFLAEGWNESIVKINILSREWDIVRNNLTGAIICRTQSAAIVAKQKAGNCVMYSYTIKQLYNGSSYSTVSSRYSHGIIASEFLCSNASK
jgi:hypothetical protein